MAEIRFNLDDNVKSQADTLFKAMGIGLNDAIKLFINQSINSNGLPFQPHLEKPYTPNAETLKAFQEIENGDFDAISLDDFKKDINALINQNDKRN